MCQLDLPLNVRKHSAPAPIVHTLFCQQSLHQD